MEEGPEGQEGRQAGPADVLSAEPPDAPAVTTESVADISPRDRFAGAAPYALVTFAALILTRTFWMPGRFAVGFDTFAYSAPHLEVTERAVRDLRIPQINDLIFGGVPQLGNPQVGVWYPAHLLTLLFETNRAMGLIVTAHVVALGLGTVLLARTLGAGRLGAAVSGVAFLASGAVLVKAIQFEQILSLTWTPWLLVAIHRVLHSDDPRRPVAAMAAATAAVLVAGHPQIAYQTVILALALTVGFAVGDERWRRLPRLAGGIGLGAAIAAPPLVAAVAATSDSAIDLGRSLADLRSPALSVQGDHFARALIGTPQEIDPAVFSGGAESVGYLGVAALLLAVIGNARAVGRSESRSWAISLTALGVLAAFWSLGPRTPIFDAAYEVVPGFDLARGSGRWLVIVALVGALFAGIGIEAIADRARWRDPLTALGAVAVTAVAIAAGTFDTFAGRTATIWIVLAALVIGATALAARTGGAGSRAAAFALVAVMVAELGLMNRTSFPQLVADDTRFTAHRSAATDWLVGQDGYTIAFTDDGAAPDYLVPGLRPNTNALFGIPSIDGYDGGVQITERWANALYRFSAEPQRTLPMRNSLPVPLPRDAMARVGVRFVLLDHDRPASLFLDEWDGPLASDDEFGVYENPAWIGEAIAWSAAEPVRSEREASDRLRTAPGRWASVALVDDPDVRLACEATPRDCAPVGLAVDHRSPEHRVVRTSFDHPSVVMLTSQALAGWSVTVDGSAADEIVVDGLFLGVAVPAGDHVVEWRYRSPLLAPSVAVSLVALLTTIALALPAGVWARMRRPRVLAAARERT